MEKKGVSVKKKGVSVEGEERRQRKEKERRQRKEKEKREREEERQRLLNRFREHDRVSAIWIDKKAHNATVHEVTNEDIVQVIFDGFEEHGPWHAPSGDVTLLHREADPKWNFRSNSPESDSDDEDEKRKLEDEKRKLEAKLEDAKRKLEFEKHEKRKLEAKLEDAKRKLEFEIGRCKAE